MSLPTLQQIGVVGQGTNTITLSASSFPNVGITAGDLMVIAVVCKTDAAAVSVNNGYVLGGAIPWTTGSAGTDTGPGRLEFWVKVATSSETGPTVTITGGASAAAQLARFRNSIGLWDLAFAGGVTPTPGAAWSVVAAALHLQVDDLCLGAGGTPTNEPTWGLEALTAAGITFGGMTELGEPKTSFGSDVGGFWFYQAVTAGAGTVAPTIAATASGTVTNNYGAGAVLRLRELTVPGIPTGVDVTATTTELELVWAAPVSGGSPAGYEVRINSGSWVDVGLALTHTFTGLTPATTYALELRAYNAAGTGSSTGFDFDTLSPDVPPGYYRIELDLGLHTWSIEAGDAPGYGPVLPLAQAWEIDDAVEFFPAPPDLTTLQFGVQTADASDVADVVNGDEVHFRLYLTNDLGADPWQSFDGIVTQLDGEFVPSATDPDKVDWRTTVYAADDNARLINLWVGYTADWPEESIEDRCDRICTEVGLTFDRGTAGGLHGVGALGTLAARLAGAPINVLTALQASIKDAADDYNSEPPDEYYGRYVLRYVPDDGTVYMDVFRRRVFDTITLDGGLVHVPGGRWSKRPGPAAATWVIVDGTVFGIPDASAPFVRNTSLVDTTPTNPSAVERDNLGESLLPDGSTALDGWSTRRIVYEASLAPDPVIDLATFHPVPAPVVVTPIGPELEVNAVDYLAGTLAGVRFVMPAAPGGRYLLELKLRNELLPGTDLPA